MSEDEIARGVKKALKEEREAQGRSALIGCASILGIAVVIATCVVIFDEPRGVKVTREEYGEAWPFTVDEGYLDCERGLAVVFRSEGATYGLNGPGTQKHHEIDPIWREDPRTTGEPRLKGLMVPVSDLIDRGLKMCE